MRNTLLVLLALVLVVTACGSGPGAEPTSLPQPTTPATIAAGQRATVRFAVMDIEVPLYEDLIAAFEEANPDLRVQVVSINEVLGLGALGTSQAPPDAAQRLAAAADVFSLGVSRQITQQGLLRDLSPFIEADAGLPSDDFLPGTLDSYRWDGGTWGLPTGLNLRLIFYNKDAFDEAGVPYPEVGWTWDDFLLKARALTQRQGDETARWGFVCPAELAYRLIESRAGALEDYSADPSLPLYDRPEVIDALRWYADLHLREQVMPYFAPGEATAALALSEEDTLIDQGQAAMWPDFALLWWYRKLQGNVGVVPFPQSSPDAHTTPGWTDGLSMSAGTTQPDAAWRWMVFLSSQPRKDVGQGMQQMSARRSAIDSGGYWDGIDEELANALRYAVDHSYVVREPAAYGVFQEAFHAVMSEEKTVEEALTEAQARAQEDIQLGLAAQATPVPTFVVAAPEAEETAAAEAIRIQFVPGLGSFNLDPYRRLAEQFHQEYPYIIVDVKTLDVTSAGGAALDLAGLAQSADCFQWYATLQDPRSRDAILPLQPFLEADWQFSTDDFFPQLLDQFTYQGQLWGLPADVTPYIIEYNRDLFDAAGVSYPAPGWTWDEFLEAAVALTVADEGAEQYGFLAEAFEATDLLLMLERLGANLVDDASDPPSFTFDDPSVVEALTWYAGLTTEHGVKPAFITDLTKLLGASSAYLERESLINEGRAAMWTSSGTMAAIFGARGDVDVGAAPLPMRADGTSRAGITTASGYFISAQTPHAAACWQWLTFLTGRPEAVQGLPARISVAESEAYRQQAGEERADAYLSSVLDAGESSALQALSEENDWLGGAIYWLIRAHGEVVEGSVGVAEALERAQGLAEDYRLCVMSADDFSQPSWEQCLKQVDPTLPDFLFTAGG